MPGTVASDLYPAALSPVKIGPVELRNRIAIPPMSTYFQRSGRYIEQRHVDYYRERAAGGVGLIVTEQQLAAGNTKFRANCLTAFEPGAIPGMSAAADAVHTHGARLFAELLIPGAWDHGTSTLEDWHVAKGPSAGWLAYLGEYVDALTTDDIRQLQRDMKTSATNVRRAGLDGVEIHGAHGYLLQQFMSRQTNRRTDAYGGSPHNRVRVAIELGEAARAGIGESMALGVRLSVDEFKGDQGVTLDEMLEMLDLLADTGVFDYFDVSCGGLGMAHRTIAPMSVEEGFLLRSGAEVKRVVGGRAKIFVAGRVVTLAMADRAVADGCADVVCMARAHLAEPRLVQKMTLGRSDDVTRCIGTNACSGQPMTNCMLNPVSGREGSWGGLDLEPSPDRKRIVVVGAGPAGLRAAGTAAARGHEVTLFEASTRAGGAINMLKAYPTRAAWQHAVDDLERRAVGRGVRMEFGVLVQPSVIVELEPDVVVCATGGVFDLDGLPWATEARTVEVVDLERATVNAVEDPGCLGRSVVIADEVGAYAPLGLAEVLAGAGVRVRVVTTKPLVGDGIQHSEGPYLMPRLVKLGVEFLEHTAIKALTGNVLTVGSVWGDREGTLEDIESVVVSIPKVPNNALARALRDSCRDVRLIGDASAPRTVREAIYEGELLGRTV